MSFEEVWKRYRSNSNYEELAEELVGILQNELLSDHIESDKYKYNDTFHVILIRETKKKFKGTLQTDGLPKRFEGAKEIIIHCFQTVQPRAVEKYEIAIQMSLGIGGKTITTNIDYFKDEARKRKIPIENLENLFGRYVDKHVKRTVSEDGKYVQLTWDTVKQLVRDWVILYVCHLYGFKYENLLKQGISDVFSIAKPKQRLTTIIEYIEKVLDGMETDATNQKHT